MSRTKINEREVLDEFRVVRFLVRGRRTVPVRSFSEEGTILIRVRQAHSESISACTEFIEVEEKNLSAGRQGKLFGIRF